MSSRQQLGEGPVGKLLGSAAALGILFAVSSPAAADVAQGRTKAELKTSNAVEVSSQYRRYRRAYRARAYYPRAYSRSYYRPYAASTGYYSPYGYSYAPYAGYGYGGYGSGYGGYGYGAYGAGYGGYGGYAYGYRPFVSIGVP